MGQSSSAPPPGQLRFSAPMGHLDNVAARSNHYGSAPRGVSYSSYVVAARIPLSSKAENAELKCIDVCDDMNERVFDVSNKLQEVYCGHKWQCVELARRYLLLTHNISFKSIWMAYSIFDLDSFERIHLEDDEVKSMSIKVSKVSSPSTNIESQFHLPVRGTLMIWKSGGHFAFTGHVAVVTHCYECHPAPNHKVLGASPTSSKKNYKVGIAEQNNKNSSWSGKDHARELTLTVHKRLAGPSGPVVYDATVEEPDHRGEIKGYITPDLLLQDHQGVGIVRDNIPLLM